MIRRYIVGRQNDVNYKFAPITGGPNPSAPAASPRTGRAFRRRAAGNSGHGSVAYLQSSRAVEARRGGDRPPGWEKCLLRRKPSWAEFTAGTRSGNNPAASARIARGVSRSHESQARSAQTSGQSAEVFRRAGREVWPKLCAGPIVESASTYAHYSASTIDRR